MYEKYQKLVLSDRDVEHRGMETGRSSVRVSHSDLDFDSEIIAEEG